MDKHTLTSGNGRPIADNQNIQTAGVRGPALIQDPWYMEKLAHFDREVIPERRMHAKGSGAFGTFTVTNDITEFTRASIFSEIGKRPNVLSASRQLPENVVLQMRKEIYVDLQCGFIPTRETGTLWETIHRSFSCAIR